jgi:hypothetical protein
MEACFPIVRIGQLRNENFVILFVFFKGELTRIFSDFYLLKGNAKTSDKKADA